MNIEIYKEAEKKDEPIRLRLFETDGKIYLKIVDGDGHCKNKGNILYIEKEGVTIAECFGNFGIERDESGRIKVRNK